ncbi:hypothetical protein QVD99_003487 [Batrachochytrium dendrobatidis]|nr:hypothetical protein QVD99_003487 [Batrachochytrium dendrobatidis]
MKIDILALVSILAISVHAELLSANSITSNNGLRLQKRQLFDKVKKFLTKKQGSGNSKSNPYSPLNPQKRITHHLNQKMNQISTWK